MAEKELEYSPIAQMNIKAIGGTPKEAVKQEKAVFMGRIFGEATDVKIKEKRNGDMYSYLVGEFRAIGADGKKFESNKLFLPGGIFEQVESALKAAAGRPVQFGYDIFAGPDVNVAIGYRYAAKVVIKSEASDRLEAMTQMVAEKAMPKQAEEKAEKAKK